MQKFGTKKPGELTDGQPLFAGESEAWDRCWYFIGIAVYYCTALGDQRFGTSGSITIARNDNNRLSVSCRGDIEERVTERNKLQPLVR